MKALGTLALAFFLNAAVLFAQKATSSDTAAAPGDSAAIASKSDAVVPKAPSSINDSAKIASRDSFDVRSGRILGGGAGLSLGGVQVFSLWKNGLPQSLADFGLQESSVRQIDDTLPLAFNTKESPDVYNMMFPLTISFSRLAKTHRFDAAVSFSMLSKSYTSSVSIGPDSAGRRIDISQNMGLYAITLDLLYGRAIPDRYFSIDGADRTDIFIGISVSPLIAVSKTNSISVPDIASDTRLSEARDSIANHLNSVSASGIAFGWRAGIAKLRHLSKNGGIEGRISCCGLWSTLFRTRSGTLTEGALNAKSGDAGRKVSYYSSRIEISFSLVRKIR